MTTLVVLTVLLIVLFIAGLAFFLAWIGTLLDGVATNLEECSRRVRTIVGHSRAIRPGVEHINRAAGSVAGALPLLYTFAEQIVRSVTPQPERPKVAVPASGRRRSRLHETVGYVPED